MRRITFQYIEFFKYIFCGTNLMGTSEGVAIDQKVSFAIDQILTVCN